MFFNIDLRVIYHQLKINRGDIPKIVFNTEYEHFEFLVMLFGLTNVLITFISLINKVFKKYLDKFMIIFINDILIHSYRKEEYIEQLYTKLKKYGFWIEKITFLEHNISKKKNLLDSSKVEVVINLPKLITILKIRIFLG